MFSLDAFGDLLQREIGPFAPKPTSIAGDQMEATQPLWTSANGQMETGIWECTPAASPPTAPRTPKSATSLPAR